jgi:hypothetical protein
MERSGRLVMPEQTSAAGDGEVLTTDETVRTIDDTVRTTDPIVESDVVTPERAVAALWERFGPVVEADYLPGKTELRDALVARFDVSELTAEELCDELERADLIRYLSTDEGSGWHVHAEEKPE